MAKIDQEVKTKFQSNHQRMFVNIVFTSGWIKNLGFENLKPFGISFQQYNILRILRGAGDWVAMSEVKALMVDKSPNATRLADKMLQKEIIQRKRSETDRRVVYLRISAKGLALLEEINRHEQEEGQWEFMNRITEEEARLVSDILDKLRG